jgi:hypothetical protein
MRVTLIVLGIVVAAAVAMVALVERALPVPLPRVGAVEAVCADAMRRPPDLSWTAPDRERKLAGRRAADVTIGELPLHGGRPVRVAGVLHVEFEFVALYPSRDAMERGRDVPWVMPDSFLADGRWRMVPDIGDRCAVVEGLYLIGPGGHHSRYRGAIDMFRLEVWSAPHRPLVTRPVSIAREELACTAPPSMPERLPDAVPGASMAAALDALNEAGEFRLRSCVADVRVSETGTVDSVRVVRPQGVDPRVASAIAGVIRLWRYRPAQACGRPVPSTFTVVVQHCPHP